MKSRMNLVEAAMKYKSLTLLVTGLLVAYGLYALLTMPRQEFPQFTIRQGLVIGVYPGASSAEVEEQLTTPLENYLFGYQEVNKQKTYSISKEGQVIVFVEVNAGVKNPDAFWAKLRHGLNEQKGQLPSGVLALIANNDFGDTSALLLTLESKDKTYKELEVYMKQLENQLRKIPEVSKLKHSGLQKEQITVYLQNDKLASYGIKQANFLAALRSEGGVSYAGSLNNGQLEMPIHLPIRYTSENDVGQQIIYADPRGGVVRLHDVARIVREYGDPESKLTNNGTKSLLLSLEMQPGNNIVKFGEEVDAVVAAFSHQLPQGVTVRKIADQPTVVDHSISHFMEEFGLAILSVIIVTMLLLPIRVGAVAGATIPISILITLGALNLMGIELHTVSLAGLIIVLGMVVDNSIVVIDNHVEKLDHGLSPWEAAWRSASELFMPIFSATLAILAAYAPLMFFLTGIGGDFIGSLPITIGVALGASLLVAALLVPYMNYVFIRKGLKKAVNPAKLARKNALDYLQQGFDWSLERAFKYPVITTLVGVGSIGLAVLIALRLPQQLFPTMERNQFAVEIYLPDGSALEQTNQVASQLEQILRKDKRVTNVASFVGSSSPRFHTTYAPNVPSANYAQFIVNTTTNETTLELLDEGEKKYSNYFSNAYVRWKQLDMSTSSAPIEIRLAGDNIADLKRTARQVTSILCKSPTITWIRDDYQRARPGVNLLLNEDEANRLGFTRSVLATSIAIGFKGVPIATLWEGDYPVNVVLINEKNNRKNVDDIRNQYVSSPITGATIPLRQLATLQPEWTEGQIVRRNGVRTLTLRADVARNTIATDAINRVKPELDNLKLPEGVSLSYGGEIEGTLENFVPMEYSLTVSVALIFLILAFQFRNLKVASLIMTTMPLSIFGAMFGLWITNYPFSFTAFIGIISLCGIVVRNGIILVDYAEELRRDHGLSVWEAAIGAGKRRMRPIFLTSAAAAVGVVPMILSNSLLWGPLGAVICFGLIFSMILTLYVLPVLYWLFFRSQDNTKLSSEYEIAHS